MSRFAGLLSAVLLLVLLLSSCAGSPQEKTDPVPSPEPEAEVSLPAESAGPSDAEPEPEETEPAGPVQADPEPPSEPMEWEETSLETTADVQEVVTYTIRVPRFSFSDPSADGRINSVFEELSESLVRFAEEDVYHKAIDIPSMAFIDGSYTAVEEGSVLTVTYVLSVAYPSSSSPEPAETSHIYRVDLLTGEFID